MVEVFSLTHPDDPCGIYEESEVVGNSWTLRASFDPISCPGFDPMAGTITFDSEIMGDQLTGTVVVVLTAPDEVAGTYAGNVLATRKQ